MDIVEEIRNDREKGAKRLESEYRSGLMTLAMRICHNSSDAAELVNHTFAEVIANIDKYAEQSAFFGWMSKILVNLHAKEKRRKSVDDIVYPGEVPEIADAEAQEEIYRNLDHSLLRDAIDTLPEDIRKTLLLHYFMDMPVKDVARFLAIPSGTVMWRLHYARQMLAAKMGAATEKPGGKAVLLALLLCGITALGAAVWHLAVPGEAQNPATATNADHATCDMRQADAYDLQFSTSSNLPQSPSGVAGSPQRGAEGGADFSQGENMNITKSTRAAMLAAATIATSAAIPATADTYTWLASPASATWDTSSLNWTVNGTDAVKWVNGNDAVFPASSSEKTIGFSGTITAHDITLNGAYTLNGSPVVTGKLTANVNGTALAYCLGGESVRIGGPANATLYMGNAGTATLKTMTLEDTTTIAPNNIRCFGPEPTTPITNVVVAGSRPSIYANNTSLNFTENRIIRITTGSKLYLGTSGDNRTITVHKIDVDPTSGQDFSSNTAIGIPSYWKGNFVFDPGEGWTNNIGQLLLYRNLTIKSGTTRLGSGTDFGTADDALMHVKGDSSFDEARRLVVDNSTLYASQSSRYVDVNSYGWVVVTNGGKVIMPSVHWLNGHGSPGRLDVADGGEFQVEVLRVSQSGSANASEIHLDEGGTIKVAQLFMNTASKATFAFDGGTFRSTADGDGRGLFGGSGKWTNVTFTVGAKGAVFNAAVQNIFWDRPLMSGVSGETDGGIRKTGDKLFLLRTKNFYTGPTVVEGGSLCPRVDDALPPGTTVRLSGGAALDFNSYETLSPARDSTNWVGRLEGYGNVNNCSELHVTNAIAPSVGGTFGFAKVCDLRGDYEISASSNKCSCIYFNAAGQDISGLKLKLVPPQSFDKEQKYQILRAPNGYTGTFDTSALPSGWQVEYGTNAAYLKFPQPFVMTVR